MKSISLSPRPMPEPPRLILSKPAPFAIMLISSSRIVLARKVVEVSTSNTGKHGHSKCHFVAIEIFNRKKLDDIVPSSHNCDVHSVIRTDYQLIDMSEDGFV
ncbi:hypothetical protein Lser_V15G23678 [Lactuca serriola]